MAKVDVELVKMILQRNDLDIRTVSQIVEDIQVELAAAADEERPAPIKKQFVVLLSRHNGQPSGQGWVLQIPEEDNPAEVASRLFQAAREFNQTPKGRRIPVKTIGETCEVVSARILKELGVWVKTREPVAIGIVENKLPGMS